MPVIRPRTRLQDYLFAFAAVGVAILLRIAIWPLLGPTSPYLTLYPAVILAAYRGGFWPGMAATLMCVAGGAYLFFEPFSFPLRIPDVLSLAYFVILAGIVSWIADQLRSAQYDANERRRLWQQTLSSIGDAVMATDTQGRVTFMNPVAEALTGWPAAEARGRAVTDVFQIRSEVSHEPVEGPVQRILREGQVVGLANHTVLTAKDGRQIPIDDSGAPIRDRKGELIGTVLVFRDITERRESERRMRRSQEQLTTTLESITDAFISLDSDWRLTYINEAACHLMERKTEDVLGHSYWEVFSYMTGSGAEQQYRRVMVERVPAHFELQSPRSKRWYGMHVYPAADGGLSMYFRDISEQKEYESKLRDQEQRLNRLAESNVIGILFGNAEGAVREANDEFLRMTGHTREELKAGRIKLREITPREHDAANERALAEARERGSCTPYETEFLRPDGSRVPVLVGYVLLGESRVESVAFIVDLTERKESERTLQRINEDLQHFTYGASHDLKEPLRMVSAYSQLLVRKYNDRLGEDAVEYLRFIQDGVDRMRALVDSLLEYSSAGEVRQKPEQTLSLEDALQDAITGLHRAIDETNAVITHDTLPKVMGEQLHVAQLFQNLVGNAINYRSEEAPRIHISSECDGKMCVVSVEDNGLGIAPEYQKCIFEVFQRLHARGRSGSGIGLATCKRIVERYGGSIWVESEGEGRGSTFRFTLPRASS